MEGLIEMSERDIDRLRTIRDVLDHRRSQTEAAQILRISTRQVRRLCTRVREMGHRGVIHRLRGRPSNHHLEPDLLERAIGALHDPLWQGFGPSFATEKLQQYVGITLSPSTVRRLMMAAELWRSRTGRAKHRAWRERRPRLGMLVQLDGSDHDWFEGRGPRCVLLIYIDDATSRILYGEFVEVENTLILMRSTRSYLRLRGRPFAFYVDKDSIYKTNRKATVEEELREEYPMTQFTRAMSELGIEVITANSPQAKGRVERGFDTHQDRLVKELRLRGISSMGEANEYLWKSYIPEHNRRYAVAPAQAGDAHRPLLAAHNLAEILSQRTERSIARDFTVRHDNKFFQLLEHQPVRLRPNDKLIVEMRLDGSTHLKAKGRFLNFKRLPERPKSLSAPLAAARQALALPRPRTPHQRRPWRLYSYRRLGMRVHYGAAVA